ncbi:MAG: GPR endopeptidase [Ruminococcaceae bacterium]|nr:GPR endopeptidase [Oscillospiraceae bacterium]
MKQYTRTDLAVEKKISEKAKNKITLNREKRVGNAVVTEISIFEKNGEKEGKYVTVSRPRLWSVEGDEYENICELLSDEIKDMICRVSGKVMDGNFSVLVAGLGNSEITADAIGPLTVKNLTVTRHLRDVQPSLYSELGRCEISALVPGVLGQTGIETVELIRGATENSKPDIVIAVDALAAKSCDRLASVVQLSDTGIKPGSGIGNTRKAISLETLGVPVISIGVPTVVDSSTLVYEALEKAGIKEIGNELINVLENGRGFFVTPKESDIISKSISSLLSDAISRAFLTDV